MSELASRRERLIIYGLVGTVVLILMVLGVISCPTEPVGPAPGR